MGLQQFRPRQLDMEFSGCTRWVQNISTWTMDSSGRRTESRWHGTDVLHFDIEKLFYMQGDGKILWPHRKYSMMIDRFYIEGQEGIPTAEQYMDAVKSFKGFDIYAFRHRLGRRLPITYVGYENKDWNIFTNYIPLKYAEIKAFLAVGVIQTEPVETLEEVISEILPRAVNILNRLSQTITVTPEVVETSIKEATEKNRSLLPFEETGQN